MFVFATGDMSRVLHFPEGSGFSGFVRRFLNAAPDGEVEVFVSACLWTAGPTPSLRSSLRSSLLPR